MNSGSQTGDSKKQRRSHQRTKVRSVRAGRAGGVEEGRGHQFWRGLWRARKRGASSASVCPASLDTRQPHAICCAHARSCMSVPERECGGRGCKIVERQGNGETSVDRSFKRLSSKRKEITGAFSNKPDV